MAAYNVRIGGSVVKYDLLRQSPEKYHQLFAAAKLALEKDGTRPCCMCSFPNPALYIGTRVHPYLATMPHTSHLHNPQCDFWDLAQSATGLSQYQGAFVEHGHIVDVKFGFSLKREREARAPSAAPQQSGSTDKRGTTSLLGLLHFLWERSRNSMWFPYIKGTENKSRSWKNVVYHLNSAVAGMTRGRSTLSELLYVVPAFSKESSDKLESEWNAKFTAVIESASTLAIQKKVPQRSVLLIGEVANFEETEKGWRLKLKQTSQRIFLSKSVYGKLQKSFGNAITVLEKDLERVVFCGIISATERGYLVVDDAALMRTNRQYIPVDSSYERELADHLIDELRLFVKPLRYDAEEMTLPDFVLLDTAQAECPLEVYGLAGQTGYDQRMIKKIEYYRSKSLSPWSWTPTSDPGIPILPARRTKTP